MRKNFASLIKKAITKLSGEINGYIFDATEMNKGSGLVCLLNEQ